MKHNNYSNENLNFGTKQVIIEPTYDLFVPIKNARGTDSDVSKELDTIMDSVFMTGILNQFLDCWHYAYGMGAFKRVYEEAFTRDIAYAELYFKTRLFLKDKMSFEIENSTPRVDVFFRNSLRNYLNNALKHWYTETFLDIARDIYPDLTKRILKSYCWLRRRLSSDYSIEICDYTDDEIISMLSEAQISEFETCFHSNIYKMLHKIRHAFSYDTDSLSIHTDSVANHMEIIDAICEYENMDQVATAISQLDEQSMYILKQRILGKQKWVEIGSKLGITEAGARFLYKKIITQLQKSVS